MRARTLGALLFVTGVLAGCGGTDVVAADAPPPEVTASPEATASPGTRARPGETATPGPLNAIPPLSEKTLRRLGENRIWHVRVVDETREHPKLSAAEILALPRVRAKPPVEMSLVRQTYTGEILEDEMTPAELAKARRTVASYQNQLLWLLILNDVTYPVFGPSGSTGPHSYVSDMAAYLDPKSGKFVRGGNF